MRKTHFSTVVARLLAQTTLRNILGTKNLHEILSERESISSSMQVGQGVECLGLAAARPALRCRRCWTKPQSPGASPWNG